MRHRYPSIATPILAACVVLAMLASIPAGFGLVSAVEEWRSHRAAAQTDIAANRLIEGLFQILMERLTSQNALLSADDTAIRQDLARYRAGVDRGLQDAIQALATLDHAEAAGFRTSIEAAVGQMASQRRRVDAALAQPLSARDGALVPAVVAELTRLVAGQEEIWARMLRASSAEDQTMARLNSLKQWSWAARDVAGRERSVVSGAIAGERGLTEA